MSRALLAGPPIAQESAPARSSARASADFIAHLIATAEQLPQTRARRRAGADEAVAAYSALGHWPTPAGRALSRSL